MFDLEPARRLAESLMVDTCTITRVSGDDTFDPETGDYTSGDDVEVYAGPCKVQANAVSRSEDFGGQSVEATPLEVHVPTSAPAVLPEDTVTITAATHDAALVGLIFRVRDHTPKTYATARRLPCERVS